MLTTKLGLFSLHNNNNNLVTNNNHVANSNHSNNLDPHDLDEITNQIFGDLMLDKSDQLLQSNFDELGILDFDPVPKVRHAVWRVGSDELNVQLFTKQNLDWSI